MDMTKPRFSSRWKLSLVSGVALLLALPAYATLAISSWFIFSENPSIINASADSTKTILTFTFGPDQNLPTDFTISGFSTAKGTDNIQAAFGNWDEILGTGSANFQATYSGTKLFGPTGQTQNLPIAGNQFSGTATPLNSAARLLSFSVTFNDATWKKPSSASTVTLVFTNP